MEHGYVGGEAGVSKALEHVSCLFRPTKVQTSPFRGAEFFMGGEIVNGEERHLYLFRRADGASG
jgi:hypothetical protein